MATSTVEFSSSLHQTIQLMKETLESKNQEFDSFNEIPVDSVLAQERKQISQAVQASLQELETTLTAYQNFAVKVYSTTDLTHSLVKWQVKPAEQVMAKVINYMQLYSDLVFEDNLYKGETVDGVKSISELNDRVYECFLEMFNENE